MEIEGRSFLIAGGASGLGAATARMLIDRGGRVAVADLNDETGKKFAGELGDAARFVRADVTDAGSVQAAVDAARDAFGGLHGAVNCAGVLHAERVLGKSGPHDLEKFARSVQVNLVGTFNVVRLAAAAMAEGEPDEEGERGVIVNTSSVAAFDGQIGQAAYAASKGGVASMTLPLARELARFGIRVVAIAPGVFDTAMMQSVTGEIRESLEAQTPFPKRFGRPEEYASLVEAIVTNRMLNGTTIRLDGALRMAGK